MDVSESKISPIIEEMLKNVEQGQAAAKDRKKAFARSLARQLSIKRGQKLESQEMNQLTEALFSCQLPYVSIDGEPILKTLHPDDVQKLFLL